MFDYLMGLFLIASPWIFNFSDGTAAQNVPVVLGIGMLIYSVFTDYEMGVIRVLDIRTHLTMDFLSGLFLALSPWLFNFDDYVYLPHLILGVSEIAVAMFTETTVHSHHTPRRPAMPGYHDHRAN